jgi:hypothetical protein
MRLQERLKRRFFPGRALSMSPSHAPANSEQTELASKGKVAAGNEERNNGVDLPDVSSLGFPTLAHQLNPLSVFREYYCRT